MTAAAAATLAVHRSRKLIPDFRLRRPQSIAEADGEGAPAAPLANGEKLAAASWLRCSANL
jgi:hypothetical protein